MLPVLWSAEERTVIRDLADINHLLIAGAQGQGKSNFVHQILLSLLCNPTTAEIRFLLIDFKRLELSRYTQDTAGYIVNIPDLTFPSVIDSITNTLTALQSLCLEIDHRLDLFVRINARNIKEYRKRVSQQPSHRKDYPDLPYILVVIDELADLELHTHRDLRETIERLLFTAAKTGIIVIISTGVIPGSFLPANIMSAIEERAIFHLFDRDDYRKFLNTTNFPPPQTKGVFVFRSNNQIISAKSILIDSEAIDRVINYIGQQPGPSSPYLLPKIIAGNEQDPLENANRDALFEDAARLIVQNQSGSTSLIQRRMKLGYNRAGRLMDQLEAAGVVGPDQGSRPREVLISSEQELDKLLHSH